MSLSIRQIVTLYRSACQAPAADLLRNIEIPLTICLIEDGQSLIVPGDTFSAICMEAAITRNLIHVNGLDTIKIEACVQCKKQPHFEQAEDGSSFRLGCLCWMQAGSSKLDVLKKWNRYQRNAKESTHEPD